MRVETRELGVVDIDESDMLDFVEPIRGFESCRRYVILPAPNAAPFNWLQSLDEKQLAFPVVAAAELGVVYRSGAECLFAVNASSWDQLECWIVVSLPADGDPARANLRAPVVVNPETRHAAQVIVRGGYPVSYALTPGCRPKARGDGEPRNCAPAASAI